MSIDALIEQALQTLAARPRVSHAELRDAAEVVSAVLFAYRIAYRRRRPRRDDRLAQALALGIILAFVAVPRLAMVKGLNRSLVDEAFRPVEVEVAKLLTRRHS
jgi:hypothetical protein